MDQMSDKEFLEFLEFYNEKSYEDKYGDIHYCYDTLSELSRSETKPFNSVIDDSFEMYGLDWMAKVSDKWKIKSKKCLNNPKRCKFKLPKSVDAIHCKRGENGKLELHLIEFKFVGAKHILSKIDYYFVDNKIGIDEKHIKGLQNVVDNNFIGRIESSLELKPYGSLFVILPGLYDEYCEITKEVDNDFKKKDIHEYLKNIEKHYWVCIDNGQYGTINENNLRSKAKHLEKYCKRMESVIFKRASAKTKNQFKECLKQEIFPDESI